MRYTVYLIVSFGLKHLKEYLILLYENSSSSLGTVKFEKGVSKGVSIQEFPVAKGVSIQNLKSQFY